MRFIYLILICFLAPVAAFGAWLRGLTDPQRRERMADRFGRPQVAIASPVFWVHAASMGEVQAGAILVRRLLAAYPRHEVVMTTMTATGAMRVRALFAERVTHCFLPYDLPFAVRGFLDRVRPQAAIVLETELWPNLLRECSRRRLPAIIASARISPRTAGRYRRFASLFREALREVAVAAQSNADADRFKDLGARDVQVTGNIKFDFDVDDAVRRAGDALHAAIGPRFIWVAGSTHAGEEHAVVEAHRKLLEKNRNAVLLLAPRHPQRFEEVRTLLDGEGIRYVTRSNHASFDAEASILLVDTMGELLSCYASADLAFVGGSLVPVGGHNLLEPAALGVPVLCGPYMSNAQEVFDRFREADGILPVASAQELAAEVIRLEGDIAARRSLGARGKQVVIDNRGALERTLGAIAASLHR